LHTVSNVLQIRSVFSSRTFFLKICLARLVFFRSCLQKLVTDCLSCLADESLNTITPRLGRSAHSASCRKLKPGALVDIPRLQSARVFSIMMRGSASLSSIAQTTFLFRFSAGVKFRVHGEWHADNARLSAKCSVAQCERPAFHCQQPFPHAADSVRMQMQSVDDFMFEKKYFGICAGLCLCKYFRD